MKKLFAALLAALLIFGTAAADPVYVLCQPDSWVNVRLFPRKGSTEIGRVELGQELETDGVRKNGFLHLINLAFESDDGWISAGFVTFCPVRVYTTCGQINARGRVACRRSINGTRRRWLKDGQNLTIYAWSDDWSITNQGFIQTRFIGGF